VASFLLCLPKRVGEPFVPPLPVVPERLAPLTVGGDEA